MNNQLFPPPGLQLSMILLLLLLLQCWTSWRSCWVTWRQTWPGYRPRCPESRPSPPACKCPRGASSADWPARAPRRTLPRSANLHTHTLKHTHTHTRRLTGWSLPELPALMGNKIDGGRPMKIQSPLSCPPTCGFSLLQICWVSRFFFVSLHNLKVVCIVSLIVASSVSINHFLHAHNSWQRSSLPLCSPYLRDPTRPHRTTEPPSPPPHRAPYTWGGPTTVRCRPDPSYQVSVWSSIIAQTQFFGLHYRCVNVSFFLQCECSVCECVWMCYSQQLQTSKV